jgi:iron-sulfur cluster assembly accessory protein
MSAVQHIDPQAAPVKLTEAAVRHFRQTLASSSAAAIRLSVKESGCTGYMYVLDLAEAARESDLELQAGEGVRLLVDRDSLGILRGTTVDYVREGVNSVLRFLNPNVQDQCGCGESFNVREDAG